MLLLLGLYKWAIAAGAVTAPALSLLGVHLATRDRAMQTLCIGQGAMVGVLLGIGLFHSHETSLWFSLGPFAGAFLVSSLTFFLTDSLAKNRVASKNTFFAFIFSMLMATSHIIGALFPGLETHMSQIYFGDLATLTIFDSQVMTLAGGAALVLLLTLSKSISNQSFEWAVFGKLVSSGNNRSQLRFKLLSVAILCLSIQFVGFLFTISMLFVPTAMMKYLDRRGLRLHYATCIALSVLGTLGGFTISLHFTRLPTVPSIVLVLFLLGITFVAVEHAINALQSWLLTIRKGAPMKKVFAKNLAVVLGLFLGATSAWAKPLDIVTTVTELAWVTQQVGGNMVKTSALLDGTENAHYIDALPDFIHRVAQADGVVIVGLDLEIGWAPKVLSRSGNAAVQPGGRGYCEAGKGIKVLDKPTGPVDRSMGDVHPAGNPHFWLSPSGMIQASSAITDLLVELAPENTAAFLKNREAFVKRMKALAASNQAKFDAAKLSGNWLMEYHQEFSYFLDQYGLTSFGSLEEKPGVAPSAGRLAQVAFAAKAAGVKVLLAAQYSPKKTLERFTEISGIPAVTVPTSIQPDGKFKDYEALQSHTVETLIKAAVGSPVAE